jgi:hypothetical protein
MNSIRELTEREIRDGYTHCWVYNKLIRGYYDWFWFEGEVRKRVSLSSVNATERPGYRYVGIGRDGRRYKSYK